MRENFLTLNENNNFELKLLPTHHNDNIYTIFYSTLATNMYLYQPFTLSKANT